MRRSGRVQININPLRKVKLIKVKSENLRLEALRGNVTIKVKKTKG